MAAKNAQTLRLTAISIGGVVLCFVIWVRWDLTQKPGPTITCPDGSHGRIDLCDFVRQYSQWSVTFEAEAQGKGKIATALEPRAAQQLSEAVQQAVEFRKYVVAGWNACAISRDQYARFGALFQNLDSLERQIGQLTDNTRSSPDDQSSIQQLITEVVDVSKTLRQ
jgi:hypothetical protein